ncbi:endocuticle structural glycoprotein SgAbd-2-like [Aricia agestis]|uniref:endocuticle structural glycoprotein SgAbd-2-like n=1 Tax=Aricia agestis TaxID=91739 RepID=UPI001C2018E0|nr:endocuticle structural glycoprotein SgAbd-2-like [Aricia agestis]
MKVLIVLSVALALAAALPQREQEYRQIDDFRPKVELTSTSTVIPILHFDKEQGTDGSYKTSYETGNNILSEETGHLRAAETAEGIPTLVQEGSYSYIAPDGTPINVRYIADEKGFRVEGDHIPTPPPVSAEIQKGLDLIYAGIEANRRRAELEARDNPEAALKNEEKAALNYKGLYYGN